MQITSCWQMVAELTCLSADVSRGCFAQALLALKHLERSIFLWLQQQRPLIPKPFPRKFRHLSMRGAISTCSISKIGPVWAARRRPAKPTSRGAAANITFLTLQRIIEMAQGNSTNAFRESKGSQAYIFLHLYHFDFGGLNCSIWDLTAFMRALGEMTSKTPT